MVWLHGGGFATGSGVEHFAYDGENLSRFGDVVAVTLNHRLNVLGHLDLSACGPEYTDSGNAGMADILFMDTVFRCGALEYARIRAGEYTPFTMVEDVKAAVKDILAIECADGQIFLFGGSQGGFVSGLAAADEELRGKITAVAMYFPAFNIPDDWRGAPEREPPLMGYSIGAEYIASVQGLDPYEVIPRYGGGICIVYGDRDTLVKRGVIDKAVRAYGEDRVDLTVIHGAGHGFTGEAVDIAAATVLDFFVAHTDKEQM